MFDIGFSELLVVGVVALIVIGPERLPKVARTAGHLLGRLQRYVGTVKSDISREMELDELRKTGQQFKHHLEKTEQTINEEVWSAEQVMRTAVHPEKESASPANISTELPYLTQPPPDQPAQGELALTAGSPVTAPGADESAKRPA